MSFEQKYLKYKRKYLELKKLLNGGGQKFFKGDRFQNKYNKKTGKVEDFRNDTTEKNFRLKDPEHYKYQVKYDDGSFESYLSQNDMEKI